jgi:hypothetical protein
MGFWRIVWNARVSRRLTSQDNLTSKKMVLFAFSDCVCIRHFQRINVYLVAIIVFFNVRSVRVCSFLSLISIYI